MDKNCLVKHAKISAQKFSLIVRCSSTDIPAASSTEIFTLRPNTVDRYYQYFRKLVLKDQEGEWRRFLSEDTTEIDKAYFEPTRVRGKKKSRGLKKDTVVVYLKEKAEFLPNKEQMHSERNSTSIFLKELLKELISIPMVGEAMIP
jgi:hypothetical protein